MRIRVIAILLFVASTAFANFREFTDLPKNPALELALRHAAEQTLKDFPKLTADNLAISVIDVTKPATIDRWFDLSNLWLDPPDRSRGRAR